MGYYNNSSFSFHSSCHIIQYFLFSGGCDNNDTELRFRQCYYDIIVHLIECIYILKADYIVAACFCLQEMAFLQTKSNYSKISFVPVTQLE